MKKDNCLFCKIASNEIQSKKIGENKSAICFMDINPLSDGHCLVISKKHYDNLSSLNSKEFKNIMKLVSEVVNKLKKSELNPLGFNYLSNENEIAGQEVFHFHMHIIPKYSKDKGLILSNKKDDLMNLDEVFSILNKSIYIM